MAGRIVGSLLVALVSCGGPAKSPFIDGFDPGPVSEGATRYILPPIRGIPPGSDEIWCQYVGDASPKTLDVRLATAKQSRGGHHLVVYATKDIRKIGTSRPCTPADQLSLSLLGGTGGESGGALFQNLPEGVTFRLPQGWGLMANAHVINTTRESMDAQGVVDITFAEPVPERRQLNMLVNTSTTLNIEPTPPGSRAIHDVRCPVGGDFQVVLFSNHMHEHGRQVYSEIEHANPDKPPTILKEDLSWSSHLIFAPEMASFPLSGPESLWLRAGDVVHTRCEWENTTNAPITFPAEMCAGVSIIIGERQINCVDGAFDI